MMELGSDDCGDSGDVGGGGGGSVVVVERWRLW